MADVEKIDDVVADARVDLLPQVEMMRVKRVVEIERPRSRPRQSRGRRAASLEPNSLLPLFTARRLLNLAESVAMTIGAGDPSMRRKLRKTLPFFVAIFLGTMTAALVAGVALLAAHS